MSTQSKSTIGYMWFFILLAALAYVFVLTGCAPEAALAGYAIKQPRTVQGERGSVGATGARGSDGLSIVGPVGPAGSDGTNGVDATPVFAVDLCPGTNNYPNVFLEQALCVQDALYAVYSSMGGLLVKLSPGAYSSNSIGSACNLVVYEHCIVTN